MLFVCLHGSAKSLIAAEHFNRIVHERGLELRAESAGLEPDPEVPETVISGLERDGIDVRRYVPRVADPERIRAAPFVVSFGCELPSAIPAARVVQWDDMPMVSDGFDLARDAIVARVDELIATLS